MIAKGWLGKTELCERRGIREDLTSNWSLLLLIEYTAGSRVGPAVCVSPRYSFSSNSSGSGTLYTPVHIFITFLYELPHCIRLYHTISFIRPARYSRLLRQFPPDILLAVAVGQVVPWVSHKSYRSWDSIRVQVRKVRQRVVSPFPGHRQGAWSCLAWLVSRNRPLKPEKYPNTESESV